MTTDYDEPRVRAEDQPPDESLEALQAQRSSNTQTAVIDADDTDTAEGYELPDSVIEEELLVQVVPVQANEFTCMSCFLVYHLAQIARTDDQGEFCTECGE